MNKIVLGIAAMVLAVATMFGCAIASEDKEMVSSTSQALVTFDPATGTGFVGKGDVQLAFGWNNAVLQTNALALTFSLQSEATYAAMCEWETGTPGEHGYHIHHVTHHKSTSVNDTLTYDARTRNQVTGFFLTGFGTTTESGGAVPVVGGPCPGNPGTGGVWISVELESGGGTGGLYVTFGPTTVLLQ